MSAEEVADSEMTACDLGSVQLVKGVHALRRVPCLQGGGYNVADSETAAFILAKSGPGGASACTSRAAEAHRLSLGSLGRQPRHGLGAQSLRAQSRRTSRRPPRLHEPAVVEPQLRLRVNAVYFVDGCVTNDV